MNRFDEDALKDDELPKRDKKLLREA